MNTVLEWLITNIKTKNRTTKYSVYLTNNTIVLIVVVSRFIAVLTYIIAFPSNRMFLLTQCTRGGWVENVENQSCVCVNGAFGLVSQLECQHKFKVIILFSVFGVHRALFFRIPSMQGGSLWVRETMARMHKK